MVKIYGTTAQFDPMVKVRTACLKRLSKILYRIREIEGVDDIFVIPIPETFQDEHTIRLDLREHFI